MPMIRLSDKAHASVKRLAARNSMPQQQVLDEIVSWYEGQTKERSIELEEQGK